MGARRDRAYRGCGGAGRTGDGAGRRVGRRGWGRVGKGVGRR